MEFGSTVYCVCRMSFRNQPSVDGICSQSWSLLRKEREQKSPDPDSSTPTPLCAWRIFSAYSSLVSKAKKTSFAAIYKRSRLQNAAHHLDVVLYDEIPIIGTVGWCKPIQVPGCILMSRLHSLTLCRITPPRCAGSLEATSCSTVGAIGSLDPLKKVNAVVPRKLRNPRGISVSPFINRCDTIQVTAAPFQGPRRPTRLEAVPRCLARRRNTSQYLFFST